MSMKSSDIVNYHFTSILEYRVRGYPVRPITGENVILTVRGRADLVDGGFGPRCAASAA